MANEPKPAAPEFASPTPADFTSTELQAPQAIELPSAPPRILTIDLTGEANDLWDRMRRGFSIPDLSSDLVSEQQIFYLNRPSFLRQVLERSGRYLYHILDEIDARGLPTELALLPLVESAYNPLARSPANASGLWQFIPSTGRNFKLAQNKWVDDRRDVLASTQAALDYLETIYNLHGDWHLALASYNWGEGSVGRAIARNREAGLSTEYQHLRMPRETSYYIPRLQALKNLIAQPELFKLTLPHLPNEPYFAHVSAPAGMDLAAAARLAEVPLEELIALNPRYNRPVILDEGASLILPIPHARHFNRNLAAGGTRAPQWNTHRLRRGETLESIARRHSLGVRDLRQINGLDARSRVAEGYILVVPTGADPRGALEAARLINQRSMPEGSPVGLRFQP